MPKRVETIYLKIKRNTTKKEKSGRLFPAEKLAQHNLPLTL